MADIASYRTLVQKFYVAYFGRPADPGGMDNMASALAAAGAPTDAKGCLTAYASNSTIRSIVDSFGTSDESKALYPGDTAAFLGAIYRNLFGRAPGSEGLAFWTGAIDRGEVVRGQAALNILVGAESNTSALGLLDATSIGNKTKVAATFTDSIVTPSLMAGYAGEAAAAAARALLAAVNGNTNITAYISAVQTTLSALIVTTPGAPDLAAADDTGWSSADNITRQSSGLTMSGTATGAVSVALYDNGAGKPIGSAAVVNGRYSIDVNLTPGLHMLTAKSTGANGSASAASGALEVVVDATAPPALVAALQTDSGKAGDGLSNQGQLTVTGKETGTELEYRVNGGNWLGNLAMADGANTVEVRQVDAAGFASPASNPVSFTLDRAGPAVVGGTPADQGLQFAVNGTLALVFGEALTVGSGNIVLRDSSGATRNIAIGDASQVTVSGKTVQIKPSEALLSNQQYTLIFGNGTLIDAAGNALVSTAAGSSLRFATTDTAAPTLLASRPADNGGDVSPGASIVLMFSEALKAGSGNIIINSGVADVRLIPIGDTSKVSIDGATVTIKPGALLTASARYSVQMAGGVLKDLAGNDYAGLAGSTALDFSVQSVNGSINLAYLASDRGIRIEGASKVMTTPTSTYRYGDRVGEAVGTAGDFNADGYDDVLIGYGQNAHILYGSALPFSAKAAELNAYNSVRLSWSSGTGNTGSSVTSLQAIADFNGDGVGELAVGTSNSYGGLYVLFGRVGGLPATVNLDLMGNADGFRVSGGESLSYTGRTIGDAGDINGDGLHELIFGADGPGSNVMFGDGSNTLPGRAFVLKGSTTNTVPYFVDLLSTPEGTWFNGVRPLDQTGSSVDGVGDFNRDGYDDFLVGSKGNDNYRGKATLVFGKAQALGSAVNVGSITSSEGMTVQGVLAQDKSGGELTGIGDFNGDGYMDFAMGSAGASTGSVRDGKWIELVKGSVSVIFGHANDGTTSLSLAQLNGKNGVTFNAHANGDHVGYDLSAAGDVNCDGFDDLIIGASGLGLDALGTAPGGAYVVFGSSKGFPAAVDLSTLDSSNSIRINGAAAGDRVGTSVGTAGDFNGDGFADLIIGAPAANTEAGAAYIVYGRDFTNAVSFAGGAGADSWTGTAAAQNAVGGIGNDSLSGGGGADVLYGGSGNDTLKVADLTFRRVDGGTGTDTFSLGGAGMYLDLAKVRNQLFGIEVIDLSGTGNNTLSLLARDLNNLSDTTNTLRVTGDTGDTVALGTGWTDAGVSNGYHCYMQGQAVILIGTAVSVTF